MVTRQQALEEIENDARKKRDEVNAKYDLLEQIPTLEGYEPPHVHVMRYLGDKAVLHYRFPVYSSIQIGRPMDAAGLRALLGALPALPTVLTAKAPRIKSLRAERDAVAEEVVNSVSPYIVVVEDTGALINCVTWHSMLGNVPVRVEVDMPCSGKLGRRTGHTSWGGVPFYTFQLAAQGAAKLTRDKGARFEIYWPGSDTLTTDHLIGFWE